MAVVNVKSAGVTNQDANVAINPFINGGGVKSGVGQLAATSGDSIGSTYRLLRIQSNARMVDLKLFNGAITTCAGDIGLYRTAGDGGAVVSVAFFSAAKSLASALTNTSVIGDNLITPAKREQRLWQVLGLTADPAIYYDVVVTLTAAAGSAGTLGLDGEWVI